MAENSDNDSVHSGVYVPRALNSSATDKNRRGFVDGCIPTPTNLQKLTTIPSRSPSSHDNSSQSSQNDNAPFNPALRPTINLPASPTNFQLYGNKPSPASSNERSPSASTLSLSINVATPKGPYPSQTPLPSLPSASQLNKVSPSSSNDPFPALLSPGCDDLGELMMTSSIMLENKDALLDSYQDLILATDRDALRTHAQINMAVSLQAASQHLDTTPIQQAEAKNEPDAMLLISPKRSRASLLNSRPGLSGVALGSVLNTPKVSDLSYSHQHPEPPLTPVSLTRTHSRSFSNISTPSNAELSTSNNNESAFARNSKLNGHRFSQLSTPSNSRSTTPSQSAHLGPMKSILDIHDQDDGLQDFQLVAPASGIKSTHFSHNEDEDEFKPLGGNVDDDDDDFSSENPVPSRTFFSTQIRIRKESASLSPYDPNIPTPVSTSHGSLNSDGNNPQLSLTMSNLSSNPNSQQNSQNSPLNSQNFPSETRKYSNTSNDSLITPLQSILPSSASATSATSISSTLSTTSSTASTKSNRPVIPRRPAVVRPPEIKPTPVVVVQSAINPALQKLANQSDDLHRRPSVHQKRTSISLHNQLGPRHEQQDKFDFLDVYIPRVISSAKQSLGKLNNGTIFHYFFRSQIDLILTPEANHNKLKTPEYTTNQQVYQDKRRVELFAQGVLDHELFIIFQKLFFTSYLNINGPNSLPGIFLQQLQNVASPNPGYNNNNNHPGPASATIFSSGSPNHNPANQNNQQNLPNNPQTIPKPNPVFRKGSIGMTLNARDTGASAQQRENAPDSVPFYKLKDYYGFSVEDYWSLYLGNSIYNPNYE
jgi:hypothetical protein